MSNRGRRGQFQRKPKPDVNRTAPENLSPIAQLFQTYQAELDTRYDKHERLVKRSRDITIESKRIIFLLHRITSDGENEEILKEAEVRLRKLFKDFISGISVELTKREVYQFARAFSPGLQEFIEAISFYYYLKTGNVVNIEEIYSSELLKESSDVPDDIQRKDEGTVARLAFSEVLMPPDFILGIADLTGELMRKCINSVASGDIEEPFQLCLVLQNIHEVFLVNSNHNKELKRKLFVLRSSLQKVENACYAIKIRGSEIPKHMLADFFSNEDEYKDDFET